ncbi:UNVERIFIED_CONTAM: hypothetical protein FKN15_031915 [Acipenser sinensis]
MLHYLLPWMNNIELVDFKPSARRQEEEEEEEEEDREMMVNSRRWLRGEGWGSPHATTMVLNNLMFMTAKLDELSLVNNHLLQLSKYNGQALARSTAALVAARRQLWLAQARVCDKDKAPLLDAPVTPGHTFGPAVDEMLKHSHQARESSKELARLLPKHKPQTRKPTKHWQNRHPQLQKQIEAPAAPARANAQNRFPSVQCGGQHKPLQASSPRDFLPQVKKVVVYLGRDKTMQLLEELVSELELTDPVSSAVTHMDNPPYYRITSSYKIPSVTSGDSMPLYANWRLKVMERNHPEPLPFPPTGGCWSPLVDYLPETTTPGVHLHRCNIAVILLTDLIVDHSVKVEWGGYLHLLLHAIFIGFDHQHPEVYEHCKRLLMHLLIVQGGNSNVQSLASVLLRNREFNEPRVLTVKQTPHVEYNFTGVNDFVPDYQPSPMTDSGLSSSSTSSSISLGTTSTAIPHLTATILNEVDISADQDEKVKALIEFITSSSYLLYNILFMMVLKHLHLCGMLGFNNMFYFLYQGFQLEQLLSEVSLQTALSCSSRHYAGRSFQIFRALKQPLTANTLSDVLSRLVETVGDAGEEAQGFVIELLLTLESGIDTLAETMKNYDLLSALSQASYHDPLLGTKFAPNRKSTGQLNLSTSPMSSSNFHIHYNHARSNSLRASLIGDRKSDQRRSNTLDLIDGRMNHGSLARTRSLSSLREGGVSDVQPTIDPSNLMATIFWIAASLLESDYEFEYLLALRLLNKLLSQLPLDRSESREKIEKVQSKLKWYNFPGLQQLFLKGFTSASTQELTIHLLSKLITLSRHTLVDPSQVAGFPLNILCLLPHLIQHFDNPTQFCKETADKIAKVCAEEKSATLSNLAHMMSLYSTHSYSRDCSNWINVVCRYLHDSFSEITFSLVTYLAESPFWKEAQNILKLVVSRSASLVVPDVVHRSYSGESSGSPEIAFTRIFNSSSKELPGKTLDFHFDISETPIIGHKYGDQHTAAGRNGKPKVIAVTRSTSSTSSGSNSNGLVPVSWKRPQLSQRRTREKLMNVLSLCGPESGLPKNPSGESMDNFNWGVRRRSLDSIDKGDTPSLQECQYSGSTPSLNLTNQEDTDESSEEEDASAASVEEQASTVSEDTESYSVPPMPQESQDPPDTQESQDSSEPPAPDSPPGSICEEDVTLALKELDERCEEEEADFSGFSSQDEGDQEGFPEVQTSPPPSPFLSAILAAFQPVSYDNEEDAWRCHVNQMLSDTDGSCVVNTFHVFSRLFQLVSCGLLETLKFSVLELQEHLDTYNVKREAAEQWLGNCKITFGEKDGTHRPNTEAQELELCRRLYKLHFQLLLLFQAYCKLISHVDTVKTEAEVINMSEELAQLESSLKEAEATADRSDEEIAIPEAAQASSETAIHSLIETLRNKEFVAALAQVKTFRSMWPNEIFGNANDDAVQTLLHIYFRHQTLGQTGSFAIVCSNQDLSEAGSKLMELNMEIRESLRMVQSYQPLAQAKLPNTSGVTTGF